MTFTVTQTVFLEQILGKGNLDTKEVRQSVTDIFTKETGETFDVERENQDLTSVITRVNFNQSEFEG